MTYVHVRTRFGIVSLALLTLLTLGIGGYMAIERWSFFDALYMTIVTFTTVGYAEVHPLSNAGRVLTTFLMVGGVGVMLCTLSAVVQTIVEEEALKGFVRRRRMKTRLARLHDHFILCGFGRVGKETALAFRGESVAVTCWCLRTPAH